MKNLFISLALIGMLIITIIAFKVPNDPYQIIPALTPMSFDKPLWFAIIVGGGFVYLMTLLGIYDKIEGIE